ncbi:hypothetical protein Cni_G13419 [Canna indica]|uniref:Transcription factor MYBS1 n=1 Tax=Canna indica TaxID=4628 RepID=A0AAQ3KDZ2_9LILI|nr:hypothetical protein Cni_G13419 [Canna indica]
MTARAWMEVLPPASVPCFTSSNWFLGEKRIRDGTGNWTPEENKRFEYALAEIDINTPDCWARVAEFIPGKTATEVESHYRNLLEDVSQIEAGRIPCPGYDSSSSFTLNWDRNYGFQSLKQPYFISGKRSAARALDQERKKGVPWTEEEHKRFLLGLKAYGKGDWRNISRSFVITRTPTQVASHAQKYFIRLNSGCKDKRRSSIHDITTANLPDNRSPSPSQSSTLTTQSSSASTPILPSSYSSILDSNRPNDAPCVLGSLTQGNQLMQPHYGVTPQSGTLHDPMVYNNNLLSQMQPKENWYLQ